jgi:hypothetical protein
MTTVPYFELLLFYNQPTVTNLFLHLAKCFPISFGHGTLSDSKNLSREKIFTCEAQKLEHK